MNHGLKSQLFIERPQDFFISFENVFGSLRYILNVIPDGLPLYRTNAKYSIFGQVCARAEFLVLIQDTKGPNCLEVVEWISYCDNIGRSIVSY